MTSVKYVHLVKGHIYLVQMMLKCEFWEEKQVIFVNRIIES